MMSNVEAERWSKSRSEGLLRFLLRGTLLHGFLPFALIALVFWFGGFSQAGLPRELLLRMLLFGFLAIVGGALALRIICWLVDQRRYRLRMAAEARGELPSSAGA